MNTSDFLKIIDDYNPDTFEQCKNKLYDILRFKVLSRNEIRPCDMKERLVHYFNANTAANSTKQLLEVKYALFLASVLIIMLGDGQIDDKYTTMFQNCIDTVRDMGADINTLDKMVLVYSSQLRGVVKNEKCTADKIDYYVYQSDLDTAEYILKTIDVRERKEKKGLKIKKEKEYTEIKYTVQEREFLYIITVLIIYRILQYEGEI